VVLLGRNGEYALVSFHVSIAYRVVTPSFRCGGLRASDDIANNIRVKPDAGRWPGCSELLRAASNRLAASAAAFLDDENTPVDHTKNRKNGLIHEDASALPRLI
jgi:hypothetical protein